MRPLRAFWGGLRRDLAAACDFLRDRWLPACAFAVLATYLACRASVLLSVPEFSLLDAWIRSRPPGLPDPRIALVGIERAAVERYQDDRPGNCICKLLPRDQIGAAVKRIKAAGARVVALDLTFSSPCPVAAHDRALQEALAAPGETIVTAEANPTPDRVYFSNPCPRVVGKAPVCVGSPVLYNPHGVVRSIPLVQTSTPTRGDRKRAEPLELVGQSFPPLAGAAYSGYVGMPCDIPVPIRSDLVECAGEQLPVWPSEQIQLLDPLMPRVGREPSKYAMLINWVGPTGTFPMYRLGEVLGADPKVLAERFRDKVVLLGAVDDRQHTPMVGPALGTQPPLVDQSGEVTMSGLEIHANALDTLLRHRFIRLVPTPLVWLLLFTGSFITIVVFSSFGTARALGVLVVEGLALVVLARLLVSRDHWLLLVTPALTTVLCAAAAAVYGYARASQEAAHLAGQIRTLDTVTTTVVHDLKQPLAAINALAAVLRQQQGRGVVESSPELLQRIQSQVDRALGDIDTLLTTDPHREVTLQTRQFDLAAVARDLAVTQSLASPVHRVEVHGPDQGAWLTGDPRYLARALNNLMENAIKYWPAGGTVVVEVESRNGQVITRVIDHGLGIPRDQHAAIFGRFQRAVPENVDIAGTGVGLYSVKRIVSAHGGTINVESEPGQGSTFTMAIPVEPQPTSLPLWRSEP